jgi:hypothetical protein
MQTVPLNTSIGINMINRALLCLLAATSIAATTYAWSAEGPEPQQLNIEQLRSRLNLTAEQQQQIEPLAAQRRARLEDIHTRMSGTTSRRDKFQLMKEAKKAQDDFVAQTEPLLTAEQRSEWKKMREEAQAQMKERWRNRQNP